MTQHLEVVAVRHSLVDLLGPATMWDLTDDEFEADQRGVRVLPATADGMTGTDGVLLTGTRGELIAWFEQQLAALRQSPGAVLDGETVTHALPINDPLATMLRALPSGGSR